MIFKMFEPSTDFATPYDAGFDNGKNGPNTKNCHFGFFSTAEKTMDWERGSADGKREKEKQA